jgi:Right handed beta helix region
MKKNLLLLSFVFASIVMGNAQKIQTLVVSTTDELIGAIESNRIIRLKESKYLLSDLNPASGNPKVKIERVHDGFHIVIQDVKNLKIIGAIQQGSKLITNTRYANVLSFRNCEEVSLENIEAGHAPYRGYCTGGVFAFNSCKKINVKGCVLFGSGTEGVSMENCIDSFFQDITIKSCTYGIMSLSNCRNITFQHSRFTDNQEFDLINVYDSENIVLIDCHIDYNKSGRGEDYDNYALFNAPFSVGMTQAVVILKKCVIEDNYTQFFCRNETAIRLEDCKLDNNIFEKGYKSQK